MLRSQLGILHNYSRQAFWILHIDRLNIAVKLLFCAFLIVSLSRYSDTQAKWDPFDTRFPDFLVQLRIKANVFRTLFRVQLAVALPM